MDNFRRPKHQKKGAAIDGIIRPTSSSKDSINFQRSQSYQPSQSRVGNFRQREGFVGGERRVVGKPNPDSGINQSLIAQPTVPIERRGKKPKVKKRRRLGKIAKRSFLVIIILALLGGGYLFGKGWWNARKVLKGGGGAAALNENVDPAKLKGEGDGRVNILMLGKGGAGHEAPDLTDTLLVASIDPKHKEAALVSIPRDFYVKPHGQYTYTKINAVYANAKSSVLNGKKTSDQQARAEKAGLEAAQKTVENTLGIPIHYYSMVDFEAFRKAIDTVGGVDVNVKEQLYDPSVAWENNYNPLIAAKGMQHFNGKKALLYARSRQSSPRGDFDRAERQREILIALKDKVFSAGTFGNPLKISSLIDAFGGHVQTNFSIDELMRLYSLSKDIQSSKVQSIGLADPPNNYLTTGNYNGQSVVLPRTGIGNYKELQGFIRGALKDPYIRSENASILILNGTTTTGLATKRTEELKSFGYNLLPAADTPTK